MMRAVSALLCALVLIGCKKKQPDEATSQSASADGCALQAPCALDGVSVTVTAITDSRCPKGAQCMWAGDAVVTVQVGSETLELHSNPEVGAAQAALPSGGTLVLEDLTPHPDVSGPPEDAARRVKLRVAQ